MKQRAKGSASLPHKGRGSHCMQVRPGDGGKTEDCHCRCMPCSAQGAFQQWGLQDKRSQPCTVLFLPSHALAALDAVHRATPRCALGLWEQFLEGWAPGRHRRCCRPRSVGKKDLQRLFRLRQQFLFQ